MCSYLQQQHQKIRPIHPLGSATGKRVQYLFVIFFDNRTQKRIISANGFPGERMLIFGLCLSGNPKQIPHIVTLLKVDFESLATHFEFRFPYEFLVEDSLSTQWEMGWMISVSEVGDRFQLPRVVGAKSPPGGERIPSSSALHSNFIGPASPLVWHQTQCWLPMLPPGKKNA